MPEDSNKITYFARTNARGKQVKFGIKRRDRFQHFYIIGKTGTGKTTLAENMAAQDILNGEGVGVIDPHGTFVEKMLDYIPEDRIKDVIYFNPSDVDYPIAFNIMEDVGPEQRHLVASGLMSVFKKLWPDVWSPRMEYILTNSIMALLEYPEATLLGVNRMLADKDYRKKVVAKVTDPSVKAFWTQEFAKYTERFAAEATPAIQNKVGQLTANPLIRNVIGQPTSSFDFRRAIDEKKIVLMNLSKGRIGETNTQIIGSMLVTKIYLAAMSRAKDPDADWPPFFLYVDEFQNFATESFKDILSESRKYGLALTLAHQYIEQLGEGIKESVFGNVGTHVVFRVGAYDSEVLEKEFAPEFTCENIVNLDFASVYLKLLIDGTTSRPFSAITLPPIKLEGDSFRSAVVEFSRENYCGKKLEVEDEINTWHESLGNENEKEKDEKSPAGEKPTPSLYETECSICGKRTVVPFEPDGKRPIYCQKHRSYIAEQKPEENKENKTGGVNTDTDTGTVTTEIITDKKPAQKKEYLPKIQNNSPKDNPSVPNIPKKKEISLGELNEETSYFKGGGRKRREKTVPDFKGLRELLSEVVIDRDQKAVKVRVPFSAPVPRQQHDDDRGSKSTTPENKESVLKPGDKISF